MAGDRTGIYGDIPIKDVARRCGLIINAKTRNWREVEASCPFCGDRGPGKYHLSMNVDKNLYRCNLCDASGNSISLYARLEGTTYKQAFEDLTGGNNLYRFPRHIETKLPAEKEPKPPEDRHKVYECMLSHLSLSDKHNEALRKRGLPDERIERNMYRSMPETDDARVILAEMLSDFYDLDGIPGFYRKDGRWTLSGKNGLLIPIRGPSALISGLQIRTDDEAGGRHYRWLSSRRLPSGTGSKSRIHVTGDKNAKTAYLTEGALKGDVASFYDNDALFICFAGINALDGLKDAIESLKVDKAVIAVDMDKITNEHVRSGIARIMSITASVEGLKTEFLNWDMSFKGVDDYYHARHELKIAGKEKVTEIRKNEITRYLSRLWRDEYPDRDAGFIHACEWEILTVSVSSLKCENPEHPEEARRYYQLLKDGTAEFPPLVCVNGTVIDGRCRYWAYKKAGFENVRIYRNKPRTLYPAA